MQIMSYLKLKYEQQKPTRQLTDRVGERANKIINKPSYTAIYSNVPNQTLNITS